MARPTVSPMTTASPIQALSGVDTSGLVEEVALSIDTPLNYRVRLRVVLTLSC